MPTRTAPQPPATIPRIIHQTWKTRRIPNRWRRWQRTWIDHHPDWEYRLWTDDDLHELVSRRFAEISPRLSALPKPIMKVDAFRVLLLLAHGGVYVDLDYECLKPIEPLLAGHSCVIAKEPYEHARELYGLEWLPSNAFLASVPGHPFWEHYLRCIFAGGTPGQDPVAATGPVKLRQAFDSYGAGRDELTLVEPGLLSPLADPRNEKLQPRGSSSSRGHVDPARGLSDAFAVHWWRHSWIPNLWFHRLVGRAKAAAAAALARVVPRERGRR
jgi:mannosyltransferase OCH1-like enzyme